MTDYTDPRPALAALRESGLPVTYRRWAPLDPPPMPYVVLFRAGRGDVAAEDGNYLKVARFCAQLYSEGDDFASMAAVEGALDAHRIAYQAHETGGDGLAEPVCAVYYFNTLGAD